MKHRTVRASGGLWAGLLMCGMAGFAHAQIVLNEVMADNQTAVANGATFPDWIELYNASTSGVSLAGWTLSDDMANPARYVFPAEVIPAGSFLVVWCDNATNAPGLHTGWNLSRGGELVGLYQASQLKDFVEFGLQIPDLSIGRVPDGTGAFQLTRPTCRAPNLGVAVTAVDQRDAVFINEWMANPGSGADWFELYNPAADPVSLAGLFLSDRTNTLAGLTNRQIPALSFLGAHGFARIWADDSARSGVDHSDFKLSTSGDQVILFASNRLDIINHVVFGQQARDVSQGRLPDGTSNIVAFARGKATPGESNFQQLTNVVVNEVLAHTDPPLEDAIELFNPTTAPLDIGLWWLSNSRDDSRKYRIPAGTVIPGGGFAVFYEYQFNPDGTGTNRSFTLNSARGDEVYLYSASTNADGTLTGYRTSRNFGPTENGVSMGRHTNSDGRVDFVALSRLTFGTDVTATDPTNRLAEFRQGTGAPNAYPKVGPLVISEIMYHPPDLLAGTNWVDNSVDEYIELYNPTAGAVPLYDPMLYREDNQTYADGRTNTWRLRGAVDYDFPTNVLLESLGHLLVVAFDPLTNASQLQAFRSNYRVGSGVSILGPYQGKLPNSGGSVELYKPDSPQAPGRSDAGLVPYVLVDRVKYLDAAPWPTNTDGTGLSLQRFEPTVYGNDPTNWLGTAPTAGAAYVPNAPPVLQRIADAAVDEFKLLTFTALATDEATPAGELVFRLGPDKPARASITADGVFRWRPFEMDGPGVYPITILVTDKGIPARTAQQTFVVTVNEVNQPPVLSMREQWVKAGGAVTFKTGYDFDWPPQQLSFSLEAGAPAGLTLDLTNGMASWSPPVDQAPGIYHATVHAVDNGVPPLSSSYTYTIHVLESTVDLVWLAEPVLTNNLLELRWDSPPRAVYYVQVAGELGLFYLGEQIPVMQTNLVEIINGALGQRFYQVFLDQ